MVGNGVYGYGNGGNNQELRINISAKKSELLYIGRDEDNVRVEDISLRGQMMKQVEKFTYLGSVITSDGKFMQDMERKTAGATRLFGMLRQRLWS